MRKFLSKKQRQELFDNLKLERIRRYAERIKVIILLDDGETYKNISKFLFLDEGSISNYRKRYEEGGIDCLINDDYIGKRTKLSEEELEILDVDLQKKVFLTTKEVIAYMKSKFDIEYAVGGITDLLHRMGYSFKKPKGVPGKAKKGEQEKFLKEYNELRDQGNPIYFGDATHPMFNTALNHGWIKRGEDVEVRTNSGRQRLNINAAIEINTRDVLARSYEKINQVSICHFLKELRKRHSEGGRINLILDNSGSNTAKAVKVLAEELNIKIIYLPPYSPNLNPIERLWKFMRRRALPNEYCDNFRDWRNAIMGFFRGIRKYKPELKTLITDNFRVVGT